MLNKNGRPAEDTLEGETTTGAIDTEENDGRTV